MRNLALLFTLPFFIACAEATPAAPDAALPPPTLEAQLHDPVVLDIDPSASTGEITASEHEGETWEPAKVPITIDEGAVMLESRGTDLVLHALEVDIAPISLPMLPGNAQLTHIALRLAAPAAIGVTWQDTNDAIAVATLDLDLVWSLTASGGTLPLGTQHLPSVPIAIVLHADAGVISASIGIDQPGALWSWADLLALADLSLVLPAHRAPDPVE
jgi:hypothetical protein